MPPDPDISAESITKTKDGSGSSAPKAPLKKRRKVSKKQNLSIWAIWLAWRKTDPQIVLLCALMIAIILSALWVIDGGANSPKAGNSPIENRTIDETAQDPVVAKMGMREISLSQIREYALQAGKLAPEETLTIQQAFSNGWIEDAIDQQLLAQAASTKGLTNEAAIRERLSTARNRILSAAYLEKTLEKKVTPEAVRGIYDGQRDAFQFAEQLRLSAIYLDDATTAVQLHNALREGVNFQEMVSDFSNDTQSRIHDGDIGFYPRNLLPDGFPKELATAKKGYIPLPFESEKGWTILRVMDIRRTKPPAFNSIKGDIEVFLRARTLDQTLAELRDEAEVVFLEPEVGSEPEIEVAKEAIETKATDHKAPNNKQGNETPTPATKPTKE